MPATRARAAAIAGFGLMLWCTAPQPARAQNRIEVYAALSAATDLPSGTVVSDYEPLLVNGSLLRSSARQTLSIRGERGPGLQAGVQLFASPHFGLQVLLDRASADVSGANGPYSVSLEYTSIQPPAVAPGVFMTTFVKPWPGTTGSLTHWITSVNAVARTLVRRVSASLSGGLSWNRLSARAQTLGYTEFHLGGHSVLFAEEAHLAFALEPVNALGFNAGGDVDLAISRHAAIVAGYRYFGARTMHLPVTLAGVTNAEELTFRTPVDDIAKRLQVAPARLRGSGSRFMVGLKFRR